MVLVLTTDDAQKRFNKTGTNCELSNFRGKTQQIHFKTNLKFNVLSTVAVTRLKICSHLKISVQVSSKITHLLPYYPVYSSYYLPCASHLGRNFNKQGLLKQP